MGLLERIKDKAERRRQAVRVRQSFSHVAGPPRFELADNQAAIVCLLRDEAYRLSYFLEWHRSRGFNRFVIIDNDSTDASAGIAAASPDTIVLRSTANFATDESLMRNHAVRSCLHGGWGLVLDVDELFDYPGADHTPPTDFLASLNAQRLTGVVAQMLDMFPESFAAIAPDASYGDCIDAMAWCDLSAVERQDYLDPDNPLAWLLAQNTVTDPQVGFLFGGIRASVFGERPALTKHPLFRNAPSVRAALHPHISWPLRLAPFTALIRHYKFTGDFAAKDSERAARHDIGTREYAQRAGVVSRSGMPEFHSPTAVRFGGLDDLAAQGFLVAPPDE